MAVTFHQYIICGKWFETGDIHHEMFVITFLFAGIVVYFISENVWRKKK